MACDAQTIINGAVSNQYYSLDDRELWLCMAGVLSLNSGLTAQQATNGAVASGYSELQELDIFRAMLAVLCP